MAAQPTFTALPANPQEFERPCGIEGHLAKLGPITLDEMDAVALLARRDTKFVLSERQLGALLPALGGQYRVLEIDHRRSHAYRTVYFDTPSMDLFYAHHKSQPRRYKVRSRLYVDSALAFFEVKSKDGRDNTLKSRSRTERLVTAVSAGEASFLGEHAPYPAGDLVPTLLNSFTRVTLVDSSRCERLTLDSGLTFSAHGEIAGLPGLVIAELKHSRVCHESPFLALARTANLHAGAFSKYCVGVSLLYPGLKHNAFKRELLIARRISGACHVG